MKRLPTSIICALCVALLLVLSACGGSSENNRSDNQTGNQTSGTGNNQVKPGNETKSGEKTKVSYWTGERGRAEFLQATVDRFNATNTDNIEVELTILSDNYAQSIDIAYASGQSPDVFNVTNAGTLGSLIAKEYLEPFDEYMAPEMKQRFEGMFVEGVNMHDGKIYTLPNYGNTYRLIYNKDLLDKAGFTEPPTTLDELVEAARKITEAGKADGVYGFALPYKSATSAMIRSANVIASLSGYDKTGFDFKTARYDFTGYHDIIESFRQMMVDGSTLPGSESLDIDPLRAQFAEGKIGMYFSADVDAGVFKNQFPTDVNWAAALVPTVDGQRNGASYLVGGSWYGMSKLSKDKQAVWKFVEHMYSKQVLMESQEVAGWLSIVPEIVNEAKLPDIQGTEYFLPGKYDGIWPLPPENIIPEGKSANDEFVDYILVGGNLSEIIERTNQRYNAALDRSIAQVGEQVKANPAFDPAQLQGE